MAEALDAPDITVQAVVWSERLKRTRYNFSIRDHIVIPSTKDCIVQKIRIAIPHTEDYIVISLKENLHCDSFYRGLLEEACEIQTRAAHFKDNV